MIGDRRQPAARAREPQKRLCGWIGAICWLLILPAKEARHFNLPVDETLVGAAPSFIGSAGLLLVILSREGRFGHLGPATLMAGTMALALEFAQTLPVVRAIYTFDWLDVVATVAGLAAGALVGAFLCRGGVS